MYNDIDESIACISLFFRDYVSTLLACTPALPLASVLCSNYRLCRRSVLKIQTLLLPALRVKVHAPLNSYLVARLKIRSQKMLLTLYLYPTLYIYVYLSFYS